MLEFGFSYLEESGIGENSYASGTRPLDNFLTPLYPTFEHPSEQDTDTISSLTHSHYVRYHPNKDKLIDHNLSYNTMSSLVNLIQNQVHHPSLPSHCSPPLCWCATNIKNTTIQNQKNRHFLYLTPSPAPVHVNVRQEAMISSDDVRREANVSIVDHRVN